MLRDQKLADRRRAEEDQKRKQQIEEQRAGKMATIMKNAEKKAEQILKVEDFKRKMQSEERERIKEKLEMHDLKIARSTQQNRECMTLRAETVRRRNQSNNDKMSMFRTQEFQKLQENTQTARDKSNQREATMRYYYK